MAIIDLNPQNVDIETGANIRHDCDCGTENTNTTGHCIHGNKIKYGVKDDKPEDTKDRS